MTASIKQLISYLGNMSQKIEERELPNGMLKIALELKIEKKNKTKEFHPNVIAGVSGLMR